MAGQRTANFLLGRSSGRGEPANIHQGADITRNTPKMVAQATRSRTVASQLAGVARDCPKYISADKSPGGGSRLLLQVEKVDREAFEDVSGEELNELLKRAVRKARLFLHPDKLPKDLTESQTFLFKTIWYVISEREAGMKS